jgi:hypothetical protein
MRRLPLFISNLDEGGKATVASDLSSMGLKHEVENRLGRHRLETHLYACLLGTFRSVRTCETDNLVTSAARSKRDIFVIQNLRKQIVVVHRIPRDAPEPCLAIGALFA